MNDTEKSIGDLKMLLRREIAKLEKQIAKRNERNKAKHNPLWLQQIANSIIAAPQEIIPFSSSCEIKNIYNGTIETISLNPKLSTEKNAALYLKKAKKALADECSYEKDYNVLSDRLQKLQDSLKQVTALRDEVVSEIVISTIDHAKKNLFEGIQNSGTEVGLCSISPSLPFRHYRMNEWNIYAGKSDEQNDELSINFAHNEDLWFHVAGFAGSHVIIRRPKGSPVPDNKVIQVAAAVAAWFSKARNSPFAEVHYTEGRFIHKRKNAPDGEVTLEKFRSIKIKPESPEILFKDQKDIY